MIRFRTIASIAFAASLLGAGSASAQNSDPSSVLYVLSGPESDFEWGCFDPCACPILIRSPLTGSFVLRRTHADPLYTYYDVADVRWRVAGGGGAQSIEIAGSGTYRRGGEVALMEQLTLDVSFDGGPPRHFDSGLRSQGAAFPGIDTQVSLHGEFCLDSVLVVDARPFGSAGVGDHPPPPALSAAPNPFGASTEIAFVLPRGGLVTLDVFDLSGRRVRRLVSGERLGPGAHVRSWDGRIETGAAAPPALYLVRLETQLGRSARLVAKLR